MRSLSSSIASVSRLHVLRRLRAVLRTRSAAREVGRLRDGLGLLFGAGVRRQLGERLIDVRLFRRRTCFRGSLVEMRGRGRLLIVGGRGSLARRAAAPIGAV